MRFRRENFRGLLARATSSPLCLQTFPEKTFADRHKTAKVTKDFTLENFQLYIR